MLGFGRKAPVQPIKRASEDPPTPLVNGHSSAYIPPKSRAALHKVASIGTGAKDKDLAEWMGYLFGDEVALERNSDIPEEAIVPFAVMKLQGRILRLTGGPSDPDLLDWLMFDIMELRISMNREGRREMWRIIGSRIQSQSDDNPEANLFGKLN